MRLTSLLFASGLIQLTFAAYSVKDDYSTERFLDMFNFDTVRLGNQIDQDVC